MPADRTPPRLNERDLTLLRFAAEHRFVLATHMAQLLGCSPDAARRRLSRLRTATLLAGRRPLRHELTAFQVTRAGLAVAGSELSAPPELDLAQYRHDVGLAWLHVAARRGAFGAIVEAVGERRMRSEDAREGRDSGSPRHGVAIGPGRGRRLHYPDLTLLTGSGHRVAFELELSTKAPAERERILGAYAADRRVDVVVYLVADRAAGDAIMRSAVRAGAADKVQVRRFAWAGGRAPGEPAHHARHRGRAPRARAERHPRAAEAER